MTVGNVSNKAQTAGDGATVAFDFTFKIFNSSDLTVYKTTAATGVLNTALVLNTDYTVTFTSGTAGGTVTYTVAPTALQESLIVREATLTQATSYPVESNLPEKTFENSLDKLTMIVQQLDEKIGRCITFLATSSLEDITIPTPSAGKAWLWNATADGISNSTNDFDDIVTDATAAQTAAETAQANAETAETNAETAQTAAETAKTAAELAETHAETAETNAETAETNAVAAKDLAETAKTAAETAETHAETAETNAETAETNAETAETNAETAETNAVAAKDLAETAKTAAETAETNAETAETAAEAARDIAIAQGIICTGSATTCTTAVATLNLPALSGSSVGQGLEVNAAQDGYDFVDLVSGVGSLGDVNITSLADNEILQYDSATDKWKNEASASGTSDKIEEGDTSVECIDTGSDGHVSIKTENVECGLFDEQGIVTFAKQSGAKAYRNATQSLADTTYVKIELETEVYDLQGEMDVTTDHRFTVKEAGVYSIMGNVTFASLTADKIGRSYIYKNGARIAYNYMTTGFTAILTCPVSTTVVLDAGDYIELYARQNTGGALSIDYGEESACCLSVNKIA